MGRNDLIETITFGVYFAPLAHAFFTNDCTFIGYFTYPLSDATGTTLPDGVCFTWGESPNWIWNDR